MPGPREPHEGKYQLLPHEHKHRRLDSNGQQLRDSPGAVQSEPAFRRFFRQGYSRLKLQDVCSSLWYASRPKRLKLPMYGNLSKRCGEHDWLQKEEFWHLEASEAR